MVAEGAPWLLSVVIVGEHVKCRDLLRDDVPAAGAGGKVLLNPTQEKTVNQE